MDNYRIRVRRRAFIVAAAVLIYFGFRLVTQASQSNVVIQNDGYAVTGGVLILLGGLLLGSRLPMLLKLKAKTEKKDA